MSLHAGCSPGFLLVVLSRIGEADKLIYLHSNSIALNMLKDLVHVLLSESFYEETPGYWGACELPWLSLVPRRFEYTWAAVVAIGVSAVLGLLVSLSTFLVIGATSSLTYNVSTLLLRPCSYRIRLWYWQSQHPC